jgi:heat shock protein HslJ
MADLRQSLIAPIAAMLLGCAGAFAEEPKAAPAAPAATSWVLERGRDIPARLKRAPQLRMEGQKLSGSTGCNAFTAALVDKADKRVAIEQVGLTRKLCAPTLDMIEQAFVRALADTQYLEQKGKRLLFLSEKRQPLLVWTPAKSAAQGQPPRKRYARARRHQHQRFARVRYHRRSAQFVHRGCWSWLMRPATRRARVFW